MKAPEVQPVEILRGLRAGGTKEKSSAQEIRPLGKFSAFICTELGSQNLAVSEQRLSPAQLFDTVERLLAEMPKEFFAKLRVQDQARDRRVGLIDLLFAIRSLDVAFDGDGDYKKKLSSSRLYQRAEELARLERRTPMLQWSDTAIYYPFGDPRSFLEPGKPRDQEVALYVTNGAVDGVFKGIIERLYVCDDQ